MARCLALLIASVLAALFKSTNCLGEETRKFRNRFYLETIESTNLF